MPVLVRQATDQQRLELAIIENVQRSDLSALEEAEAYRQLAEDFDLSHESIAARVGKSRVAVTNTLRLLRLPDFGQECPDREAHFRGACARPPGSFHAGCPDRGPANCLGAGIQRSPDRRVGAQTIRRKTGSQTKTGHIAGCC